MICKYCNGNDKDIPCAYPSENVEGCLRDKRLKELNKKESKDSIIARLTKEINNSLTCDVSIIDALEFRRDQYGLRIGEFAKIIGMTPSHYSEFVHGKRKLPLRSIKRAYAIGISASILLQK